MNRVQLFSWVLIGVGFCSCATAADALPPTLRACMQERDSVRRLACFDQESARLDRDSAPVAREVAPAPAPTRSAAPAPTAPVAAPAATAAAAPSAASAEDKFGYRGNLARNDLDKKKAAEQEFEALTAKVTEVASLPNGGLVLTLDNGQVWQQKTADRAMRIKVGDQVTIKRAVLNSFLLTSETSKGSMRVARVK